jgi:hypothetical protein
MYATMRLQEAGPKKELQWFASRRTRESRVDGKSSKGGAHAQTMVFNGAIAVAHGGRAVIPKGGVG